MKYAAKSGWSFCVLTQDPDRPVIAEKLLSEFLLAEVPAGAHLLRVGNPTSGVGLLAHLGRALFGASSLPWGLMVTLKGWKKQHHSKPDLIFVNSPPFTNVAAGLLLAALFNRPLIVDMKDDWVNTPTFLKKHPLRRMIESWVEKKVVHKASAVITASISSYEAKIKYYAPAGLDTKFHLIPNGQDMEEYQALINRQRKREGKHFKMVSAAAGYRSDYRDLSPFIRALELFVERYPQAHDQIEIEFLGEDPEDSYKSKLEKLLPAAGIHCRGALGRQALVEHLWQADLFFLIQPRQDFTAVSGTLYEYWATGKAPVLLFSELGASSSLVTDNQIGEHFQFTQVEDASRYIGQIYQAFCDSHPTWIERRGVEEFDRRKLALKMISIWSDAIFNFQES
jgi:glycosyltransferase involved in cell wall biosynthesis